MKLTIRLTNRAILLSGEDVKGNQWEIDCELDELTNEERNQIAERLFEDEYVCEGVVNEEGTVEPRVEYGRPILLCIDGTEVVDLTVALAVDHVQVQENLSEIAKKKKK